VEVLELKIEVYIESVYLNLLMRKWCSKNISKTNTFNLKLFPQVLAKPTNPRFEKVSLMSKMIFFERGSFVMNTRFWEDTYLGDKPVLVVFYLI
jgi:hypothetical protein